MSNYQAQPFRIYTAASIGPAIRQYRREAGLTQVELADLVGIEQSYLCRLEKGSETEQLRRIVSILKHLGVRATLRHEDW
ncbi:MAG TPA: helix-turn-helix domain-containing protein [Acidimicrobiales bacterium]|nr:helix-turn-helix domain-containing protein [Acidimicrobiales bacterium]